MFSNYIITIHSAIQFIKIVILKFSPYQIPTSKIQFQDIEYLQFGDEWCPHIWSQCSWCCLQFWRNYVKNITKTLKASSKISRCHRCHHHIVATILSWPSMLLLRQCENWQSLLKIGVKAFASYESMASWIIIYYKQICSNTWYPIKFPVIQW